MKTNPYVVCRSQDWRDETWDEWEVRACTEKLSDGKSEAPPFDGGCYEATCEVFASVDDEDRGGIVLRLLAPENYDDIGFVPAATEIRDGVDISLGGECESRAFLEALSVAVDKALRLLPKRDGSL